MSFFGLRWNTALYKWDSRFTPLAEANKEKKSNSYLPPQTNCPMAMSAPSQGRTKIRKVTLQADPKLECHWRELLKKLDALDVEKGISASQRAWKYESSYEEVVEGMHVAKAKRDRNGSHEGRLDGEKAKKLRARRDRRSGSGSSA